MFDFHQLRLNALTFAYLFSDAEGFAQIFPNGAVRSDLRVVGKWLELLHVGQPFFTEYVIVGIDIQDLAD